MIDKRVCFDFEIEFSNGGGIQGQGFRLDIPGDTISDRELAAAINKDLNLLMVGETRILNKNIIEESYKRGYRDHRETLEKVTEKASAKETWIDLSHTIYDGMMTYKGLPAPRICDYLSHAESRKFYTQGTEFQIGKMEFVANTGTYIDAPYHRFRRGDDLSGLNLDRISNIPGTVIRLRGQESRAIEWPALAATEITGRAVLIETGWSDHWGTEVYFENHPYLTAEAAHYLKSGGATLVGIDSYNIDNTSGGERPVHSILLAAGIPIVEHLTNLSAIRTDAFRF
ncbi:MAG: cyclase family protein [Methyloligellaceae bacterium]